MKKIFYLITFSFIEKGLRDSQKKKHVTKTLFNVIEILPHENTPSVIFQKVIDDTKETGEMAFFSPSVKSSIIFYNFWEEKDTEKKQLPQLSNEEMDEILNRPIIGLDISIPTLKKLQKHGFDTWNSVVSKTESYLKEFVEFTDFNLTDLKDGLKVFHLKLAE